MKLLQVSTLQEARDDLAESLKKIPRLTEKRPILQAEGCTLVHDIHSMEDIPAFRRSAVDGYAVVSSDTFGASDSIPVFLDIVEEVLIGKEAKKMITHGQCAYVPTGGMLPEGADAMVMVEYCELFDADSVAIYQPVACGNFVIYPGDDMKKNDLVLVAGSTLRFQEIGALAAMGLDTVEVYKPFTATIISTGDELTPLSETSKRGQVYDSNSYALNIQAKAAGMTVVERILVPDDESLLRETIERAMQTSDFVFASGGSSQGKKDITEKLFDELSHGGVYTHGLALKPGKPTILAWDESSRTILVGLPGHPVAASMVFELLISWLLYGRNIIQKPVIKAEMAINMASSPGRETCIPIKLNQESGRYLAEPILGRSGLWTTLTRADGYLLINKNSEGLKAGEQVEIYLFER